MLKQVLSKSELVVLTLICNGIFRADCVYILLSGKDCVDYHLENAWKENGYSNLEEFLFDCGHYRWVKKMDAAEKQAWKELAKHNQTHRIERQTGNEIDWEGIYADLYPEKKD